MSAKLRLAQEVRRKRARFQPKEVGVAGDDGRGQTKAVCYVLRSFCHSARSLAGVANLALLTVLPLCR